MSYYQSIVLSISKRFGVILLVLLISNQYALSQFIYYEDSDSTDWSLIYQMAESARELRDSLQGLGYTAETFTIHPVAGKKWMAIDGRLDVFEWRNDYWQNLYNGTYHGYNYNSEIFTYNGKLFSYRGYGFWREHGEIIEFLPEKGGWEIIPESKALPFGIGYLIDSTFFIHAENCFEVQLIQQKVTPVSCQYSIHNKVPHGREYNFEDYILITSILEDGSQYPLIEKASGVVYLSRRQPFKELRDLRRLNSLIHIKGNQMTILFPDSSTVSYEVKDELQYYTQESNVTKERWTWYWWAAFALIIFFFAAAIIRFFRMPKVQSEVDHFNAFKDYSGRLIDSDELDKILGIDEIIVYETRKYKRASLIHELNGLSQSQFGQELILREKNPKDRRFYLYRIQSVAN